MRTKIENVTLLPLDGRGEIKDSCVLIDGAVITYAGPAATAPLFEAGEVIKGRGRIAMPGLVNTHTHAAMTLLRGLGTDLPLQDWLFTAIFPAEDRMNAQDVYWGSMLGIMEMIRFGTSAFLDMYFPEESVAKAVVDTGIRAALSRGITGTEPKDFYRLSENSALYRDYNGACGGRINVMFGPHAEYTTSPELIKMIVNESEKLGCGIHTHVSETRLEHEECVARHGKTPTEYFAGLGLFDRHAVAAHCVHITPNDAEILADKGVYIAHCALSNLKLGSGVMPLYASLLPRTALGTDSAASNNTLNLFEEMRLSGMLHKGTKGDPTILPADEALMMAAPHGAKALGFNDVGEIREGMRADIILLDTDGPHAVPMRGAAAHAVYSAQGSDVSLTMVDGKVLYRDGEYLTFDSEKVLYEAARASERISGESA